MKTARDELDAYPLAKQYGWRQPPRDMGGLLFLFPPTVKSRKNSVGTCNERSSLEALHPHDLSLSAMEATEFLHSRIPFRMKRNRRGKTRNSETWKGKAPNSRNVGRGTVVPKETREEQSAR